MARDLFGVPDSELLTRRRAAQDELLRGKAMIALGDVSGNSSQQIIAHAREIIREINDELRARNHPEASPDQPESFVRVSFFR